MTALYTREIPLKEVRAAFSKVKNGLLEKMENEAAAMGIEPTSHALQAIEYTGFPSLVRVQLRPTSGNLKRPPSPVL
jgi:hypothetical protein